MHSPPIPSSTDSESHGSIYLDGISGTIESVSTDSIPSYFETTKKQKESTRRKELTYDTAIPSVSGVKRPKSPSIVLHEITYGPKRIGPLIRRPMVQRLRSNSQPDVGAISSLLSQYSRRGQTTGFSASVLANIKCHDCNQRPYDAKRLAEASCRMERIWPRLERQYLEDYGPVGKIMWTRCMCGTCGHWTHQNCNFANNHTLNQLGGTYTVHATSQQEENLCARLCTIL